MNPVTSPKVLQIPGFISKPLAFLARIFEPVEKICLAYVLKVSGA